MADLVEALSTPAPVDWITATVDSVDGDTVTLRYLGVLIPDVTVLDSYTPVAGDTVHALSRAQQGMLVLGSANAVGGALPVWTPGAATIISPASVGAWDDVAKTWSTDPLLQSETTAACWFYRSADVLPWLNVSISAADMELTLIGGLDPAEMFTHQTPSMTAPLVFDPDERFTGPVLTGGAPAWVPIPLDWIQDLAAGAANGIGIGLGIYSNAWNASSGRLRITPI